MCLATDQKSGISETAARQSRQSGTWYTEQTCTRPSEKGDSVTELATAR